MTANMNLLAPVIFNNIGPYGPYLQQQQTTFIPPPTTQALLEPVTNRTPYLLKGNTQFSLQFKYKIKIRFRWNRVGQFVGFTVPTPFEDASSKSQRSDKQNGHNPTKRTTTNIFPSGVRTVPYITSISHINTCATRG